MTDRIDECGCCEGLEVGTPVEVYNRPGLSSVAYRVGTHARFKRSMLAGLSSTALPALRDLNTRDDDDFAVALLDAWATVADVLTFYSERIANESYLRTATERVSLLHLARLIGYELGPGVAAGAYLVFELENAPTAPRVVNLDERVKVQSLPGQDELPQIFETVEKIEARPEWNNLRPRQNRPKKPDEDDKEVYLRGVTTGLSPGDAILLVGDEREENAYSERWDFRILQTVTPHPPETADEEGYTLVTWETGLGHDSPTVTPADNPRVFAFRQRAALFGHNAPDWRTMPDPVKQAYDSSYDPDNPDRRRTQWPDFEIRTTEERLIDLDAVYPRILAGNWVVLKRAYYTELYRALSVTEDSRTDFTLTAKSTRIQLDTNRHLSWFGLRDTVVFAQSEPLEMAEHPIADPVEGEEITLEGPQDFGPEVRTMIVSGKRSRVVVADEAGKLSLKSEDDSSEVELRPGDVLQAAGPRQEESLEEDPPIFRWHLMDGDGFVGFVKAEEGEILPRPAFEEDETVSEVVRAEVKPSEPATIVLQDPLLNSYDRATAVIYANVAPATHGETREEVLGSGDASAAFQRFTLREATLTQTSAPTPGGTESSLEVRVGDIEWHEVPDLYGLGPSERVFVTRADEEHRTTVLFGDGRAGARLPTGTENVRATYRKGTGASGLVRAGQLSLLMTPVLGVKGVRNPLAAEGGDDPEPESEARRNAPLTVLTLDRVVSLRDYEDFTRAYAGIAKALAAWVWTGEAREVFVTVAGPGGRSVGEGPLKNLVGALRDAGDRHLSLRVEEYEQASFGIAAKVRVDPDFIPERVKAALEAALHEHFGFQARSFGQGVALSEVVATMQTVPGVVMVDVDKLYRVPKDEEVEQPQPFLVARAPRPGEEDGDVLPAELLTLAHEGLSLEVSV